MEKSNRVVCIADNWVELGTLKRKEGPKKNNSYTIIETTEYFGLTYYGFKEINQWWVSTSFRPVDECGPAICEQLEKELEQTEVPMIALFCLRLGLPTEKIL